MSSDRPMKRVAESESEQVHVLTMAHMNGAQRLFGGQLMAWIDEVSAAVARRHAGCHVTTALVDKLEFDKGAFPNDVIVLRGRLNYVGTSSMEVSVKTYREALSGESTLINSARLIMVALDENGRPCRVPGLILETDEEKAVWERGQARAEARKQRLREERERAQQEKS